ncbi:hypothetical protein P3T73_16460 [Kiritimatiellota bacterium B12222]|nr:hypothetical protein P3T73_16460 [Kiritimatiellota bacterium B12222]
MQAPSSNVRPLLITFHCGIYFLYFAVFMMSISNSRLEEHFNQIGPGFIRNMLILMSICFVGYIGLWNQRRWGILLLILAGIPLCAYGFIVKAPIPINFFPLIAAITCLPFWPILKKP